MIGTVIVLTGCPASGKTTLTAQIKRLHSATTIDIDLLLEGMGEFSVEHLKRSREVACEILDQCLRNNEEIVVVDDTNHLKSMVKPYRRLVRKHSCRFLHLVIKISLEEALVRNREREKPVDERVLSDIYNTICTENYYKESVEIDCSSNVDVFLEYRDRAVLIENKVRTISEPSEAHNADLILRNHISSLIQNCPGKQKAIVAKAAVKAKKYVLEHLGNSDLIENFDRILHENLQNLESNISNI